MDELKISRLFVNTIYPLREDEYLDEEGLPMDVPRHPIIEDDVTIYSNASVLGRVTIGKGSVIGGNIWLTHSVPPYSKITQTHAVEDK